MTPLLVNGIAALLTIAVLSRIAGDNPLFRVAQSIFIGLSLGLAVVVAYHQLFRPVIGRMLSGDPLLMAYYTVPLLLGLLLLTRIGRGQRLSWLANLPLALIFGVGVAVAIGGAAIGTVLPQVLGVTRTTGGAQVIGTLVLGIGTALTLASFSYTVAPESRLGESVRAAARIGRLFLISAFGIFFAGALQTYMSALVDRLWFVVNFFFGLAGG